MNKIGLDFLEDGGWDGVIAHFSREEVDELGGLLDRYPMQMMAMLARLHWYPRWDPDKSLLARRILDEARRVRAGNAS